jgi:hypothetical protein
MSLENALIKMASENPELAEDVIDILAAAEDEDEDFYADEDEDFWASDDEDEDFYAEDEEDDEEDELIEAMLHLAAEGGSGASKSKRKGKRGVQLTGEMGRALAPHVRGRKSQFPMGLYLAFLKEKGEPVSIPPFKQNAAAFKKWIKTKAKKGGAWYKARMKKIQGRKQALRDAFESAGGAPGAKDSTISNTLRKVKSVMRGRKAVEPTGKGTPGNAWSKEDRAALRGARNKSASLAEILGY